MALLLLLLPSHAHANGGVLAMTGATAPNVLDLTTAIAVGPYGATRWTRLTVGGVTKAMWLVPARPGAALDWTTDAWLDALDDASAPRIAPPSGSPPCGMPSGVERVATYGSAGPARTPTNLTVLGTEADARAHAAARGYAITDQEGARIADLYAGGAVLVAFEIETPASGTVTTATLRVSDDGPASVPFALTGTANARTRATVFVIASGPASLPDAKEASSLALSWGAAKSNYGYARATTLGGEAPWLRESAARVIFDGVEIPNDPPAPSVVDGYFDEPSCADAARAASGADGAVARTCARGALARIAGPACVAGAGVDPSPFACRGADDLALALAGLSPRTASVSRFAGVVRQGALGADAAIGLAETAASPVVFAGSFEPCKGAPSGSSSSGALATPPAGDDTSDPGQHTVTTHGACGGSTTTVVSDDGDDSADDTSSDGACGGSTSGTSGSDGDDDGESCSSKKKSSGDDGWDDKDDDKKDDSCSKSSSSSSSSSSSGDDGWDKSDGMKAKSKSSLRMKKHRGSSPVSRTALALVAVVLPLRRRKRRIPKL